MAYWQVGKRITEEGLLENAGYGEAVLHDLADELNIDFTTLTRCIHFFQTYKVAPRSNNLTWSQYKTLIPVRDEAQRQWYADLAVTEKLNAPQLSKAIKEDRYEQFQKTKGKMKGASKLKRPTESTYLYKAHVERVIDGDTLYLKIDLGFQVFKEQRIRLAHIDCEPMDTGMGREAARYVQEKLAQADFVMVRTNKIDVYGRYVGDIFYSTNTSNKNKIFKDGMYLNQELVDKKLARAV